MQYNSQDYGSENSPQESSCNARWAWCVVECMFGNFKNDGIADGCMEKFRVPIERRVDARVKTKNRETQKIYQKNRSEVDKEGEILVVDLGIYGTHQNKGFCYNFHPPKNLSEHVRRRGNVNGILTHKKGKEWTSFPSLHCCGTCQECVGNQGIGIGGGTGAPPSAFKTGFAEAAGWFEPTTDSRLPRIASDISQISFCTFMVTPFLS